MHLLLPHTIHLTPHHFCHFDAEKETGAEHDQEPKPESEIDRGMRLFIFQQFSQPHRNGFSALFMSLPKISFIHSMN